MQCRDARASAWSGFHAAAERHPALSYCAFVLAVMLAMAAVIALSFTECEGSVPRWAITKSGAEDAEQRGRVELAAKLYARAERQRATASGECSR